MPSKQAPQWSLLRVIALWPMAPHGDENGVRGHEAAESSMRRTPVVTAALEPEYEHSYISRHLLISCWGEATAKLSESASQKIWPGAVWAMLFCDRSRKYLTERFLLGRIEGIDVVLSPHGWKSLGLQCGEGDYDLLGALRMKTPSCTLGRAREYPTQRRHNTIIKGHCTSNASDATEESLMEETCSNTDAETEDDRISSPCSTVRCRLAFDSPSADANPSQEGDGTDFCENPWYHRMVASNADLENGGECGSRSWAWNVDKQRFFCPDRQGDDKWYWYPDDMA